MKSKSLCLLCVSSILLVVEPANSASGSYGRSSGSATRSTARNVPYRSTGQARTTPGARKLGQSSRPGSVLANAPPLSPRLASIIRHEESSRGPGWLGTAFLVSLLSQHDLTTSDRSWLQRQIDAIKDPDGDHVEPLLLPVQSKYLVIYDGLQSSYKVGQQVTITVKAKDAKGKPVRPICTLPFSTVASEGSTSRITWSPASVGVGMLTCQVNGEPHRKLVRAL
jgi:hypothetical protein